MNGADLTDAVWIFLILGVIVCAYLAWDAYVDRPLPYQLPDPDETDRMIDLGGWPGSYDQ